jgi:hypothetical protein
MGSSNLSSRQVERASEFLWENVLEKNGRMEGEKRAMKNEARLKFLPSEFWERGDRNENGESVARKRR